MAQDTLTVIQGNLARCLQASKTLSNFQSELKHHISFLQEPYYFDNKVIGYPLKHKIIAHNYKPKAATIIHDETIGVFPLRVTQSVVITKLHWQGNTFNAINCYIPPKEDPADILGIVENFLVDSMNENTLIVGDFNSKNPVWGGRTLDHRGKVTLDFINKFGLCLLNTPNSIPTFQTNNGTSWIDLTLVSPKLEPQVQSWEVLEEFNNSDHRYIKTELFRTRIQTTKRLTKMGERKLLEELENDRWLHETSKREITNANQLEYIVNHLYDKISRLTKKYSKNVNNDSKERKPWWNTELEIERKQVRAKRRRYQKAVGPLRDEFKKSYNEALKKYNNNINTSKEKAWKELCATFKDNPFTLPYKLGTNKIKKPTVLPSIEMSNGESTKTEEETVRYLLGTLYQLQSDDVPEINTLVESGEEDDFTQTELDLDFTEAEVDNIVGHLKKHTAAGPDNLKTQFIQALYTMHKSFFLNIFNACLRLGHFPKAWKIFRVTFIQKNNNTNKNTPDGYRPIAINSILGKILEKLLNNRTYFHFVKNNLLPPNQYGFTHNTSAITALSQLKSSIQEAVSNKKKVIVISLDIKNAFGSVSAKIIDGRFKKANLPENIRVLIVDLLQNRTITYQTSTQKISVRLRQGAPQGSPLSPFLWNLTISELLRHELPIGASIQAFADDLTLLIQGKTRQEIENIANETLRLTKEWSDENDLQFSVKKCKFLIIGKDYQKRPPTIKLGNISLKNVKELKILGVTFDSKLSFLPHLKIVQNKVNNVTVAISRFSGHNWGMSPKQLQAIYTRALERIIIYGSPVWYSDRTDVKGKLRAIQRTPLLKISKAFRTIPNLALNIVCNIPPIQVTIEKENELFQILQGSKGFIWQEEVYYNHNLANKVNIWEIHPARKLKHDFSLTSQIADINIYTDGSKNKEKVGSAYVVLGDQNKIIATKLLKLPQYSSNFDAEAVAILEALKYVKTEDPCRKYQIISDSLSTLQGVKNPNNLNIFIQQIKVELSKVKDTHDVVLAFTKGHAGVVGNEIADELAKQAAIIGDVVDIPITTQFIKMQLSERSKDKWNQMWNEQGRETAAYQWVKNVKIIPPSFPANYYTTQAISGHGRFPFYFKKFKISDNITCRCGLPAESFNHYLTTCKITKKERDELSKLIKTSLPESKQEIIKSKESIDILEKLVKTINDNIAQQ